MNSTPMNPEAKYDQGLNVKSAIEESLLQGAAGCSY
jgi:hypothetical protein